MNYWSLSKFAHSLRRISGIPKMPLAAAREEWKEYEKTAKLVAPRMHKIVDHLDTLQDVVCFIPRKYNDSIHWVCNLLKGRHYLKTTAKPGQYADIASKISDALMLAIIEFVEEECFWMNIIFDSELTDKELIRYRNRSKLFRTLFPPQISEEKRIANAMKYIQFQKDNSSAEVIKAYDDIINAYHFAKNEYFDFEDFQNQLFEKASKESKEALEIYFRRADMKEEEFNNKVVMHCKNIVEHHKMLWT